MPREPRPASRVYTRNDFLMNSACLSCLPSVNKTPRISSPFALMCQNFLKTSFFQSNKKTRSNIRIQREGGKKTRSNIGIQKEGGKKEISNIRIQIVSEKKIRGDDKIQMEGGKRLEDIRIQR